MAQNPITIVGGGLAGLVAAIACAERGGEVLLLEASRHLGGRARSAGEPFRANFGAHALYRGRANWSWLAARDLLPPTSRASSRGVRYRHRGHLRRTPPPSLLRALALLGTEAPIDADFRSWASSHCGERAAALLCRWAVAFTFDVDPGRLSAAFVAERLRWLYLPPAVHHVIGGWGVLVAALEARARRLGVRLQTTSRVDALPSPPLILATELGAAAALLGDPALRPRGADAVLLDLGLGARRGDPSAVIDFDDAVFLERFADPSLSPPDAQLLQAHAGLAAGESAEHGAARIEAVLDAAFEDWRLRLRWRRRQLSRARTGALALPSASWPQRPAIDRGGGRFLVGDMVAAPGILSEVSFTSAVEAARLATAWAASGRPAALASSRPAEL